MDLNRVIKKPVITEKSMILAERGKYTFAVDKKANKESVKKAIARFFSVEPLKVWIIKIKGKRKRTGRLRRTITKKPDWKKAIVQLKPGQKIEIFEETKK